MWNACFKSLHVADKKEEEQEERKTKTKQKQQGHDWNTHPSTVLSQRAVPGAFYGITHLPCSARCPPSSFSLLLLATQSSNRMSLRLLVACCQSTPSFWASSSSSASKCCTTDLETFSPTFLFQPNDAMLKTKEESQRGWSCAETLGIVSTNATFILKQPKTGYNVSVVVIGCYWCYRAL